MWVWPCSSTSTPLRVSYFISRVMILCNTVCSASSVGAGTSTKTFAFGVAPVHAVQHQAVKVDVEIGGRSKSLDQRDRAAVSLLGLQPGLIEQKARDGAVYDLQHRRHQLGLCGQQQTQGDRH